MNNWFHHVSHALSEAFGSSWAFFAAAIFIVVWAVTGPMFGFSDAWQLIANTVTNARSSLINLESLSDDEMNRLQQQFEQLRERAAQPD